MGDGVDWLWPGLRLWDACSPASLRDRRLEGFPSGNRRPPLLTWASKPRGAWVGWMDDSIDKEDESRPPTNQHHHQRLRRSIGCDATPSGHHPASQWYEHARGASYHLSLYLLRPRLQEGLIPSPGQEGGSAALLLWPVLSTTPNPAHTVVTCKGFCERRHCQGLECLETAPAHNLPPSFSCPKCQLIRINAVRTVHTHKQPP